MAIFITKYLCWSWEIKCIRVLYIHRRAWKPTYRAINHFLNNQTDPDYVRQDMIPCIFVDGYQSSEGNCSLYAHRSRPLNYIYIYLEGLFFCQHCPHVRYQVVMKKSWNANNGKSADVGITVDPYASMPRRFLLSNNIDFCLLKKHFSSESFLFASAVYKRKNCIMKNGNILSWFALVYSLICDTEGRTQTEGV
jgi:hypothetical protein